MRVVIFGASGRTGCHLVEGALRSGHEVTAFVRDPSKLGGVAKRVEVVAGDVTDAVSVEGAIAGREAVLVALGHSKNSEKNMQTRGAENIVAAMEKHGVRRLVSLTGAGVRDPNDRPKLIDRVITGLLKLLQRDVLEDAERHVRAIRESGLEWVIVRVPRLTDGERAGEYRVGYVGKSSGTRVSRADVADFMLGRLEDDQYLGRMPVVSY